MMPRGDSAYTPILRSPSQSAPAQPLPQPPQQQEVDVSQADARRLEMVRRAAQQASNTYVVSDQRFTIFKDSSGQYITRFTSLRDGKVVYVPEPEMMQMLSHSDSSPVMNLNV